METPSPYPDVPPELSAFLADFMMAFPAVQEIWLFGSRVNGESTDSSDWDLLVLSCGRLALAEVARATRFRHKSFELFIASGDSFECPWPRLRDGAILSGGFCDWKWQWVGDTATYHGTSMKAGRTTGPKRAVRIWPPAHPPARSSGCLPSSVN
jgi:hypothetical protein